VSTGYKQQRKALVNAIQVLSPNWKKESEQLVKDIESEIKRLS
jgi:gas vesicle protein